MNMTQVRVTMQYLATALAAYIVGKGWLPQDAAMQVATYLVGAIPVIYGVWKSRTQGKIESAAKIPGVTIIAPDEIANATPKTNVVPASQNTVVPK